MNTEKQTMIKTPINFFFIVSSFLFQEYHKNTTLEKPYLFNQQHL
ncbi:hypothetical protein D2M30_2052 [Bacillus amyloliquefaciens]|nr:hypothetical protein D2M30_2052 [Bacillus amyloliquefaciens]